MYTEMGFTDLRVLLLVGTSTTPNSLQVPIQIAPTKSMVPGLAQQGVKRDLLLFVHPSLQSLDPIVNSHSPFVKVCNMVDGAL